MDTMWLGDLLEIHLDIFKDSDILHKTNCLTIINLTRKDLREDIFEYIHKNIEHYDGDIITEGFNEEQCSDADLIFLAHAIKKNKENK